MSEPSINNGFFDVFPFFHQDPMASITDEFSRLAIHRNWIPGKPAWKRNWRRCMNSEYDRLIRQQLLGLQDWLALCKEVGIYEDFNLITKCKKALSRVYVNIVDLMSARRSGERVRTFGSLKELQAYTKEEKKVFPRVFAKEDRLLRVLLRYMN